MKLETILNAMVDSHYKLIHHWNEQGHDKRYRQHDAFRNHIANKYKELEFDLAYYKNSTCVFCELYMITSERLED